jgi:uncharacterized protein with beta-barrel porin domain
MRSKLIIFSLIAILSNAVHAGDIFRCVTANGDVMFTNMACPAKSQVQHVASYEPVPDTPAATYSTPASTVAISAVQTPNAAEAGAAYQAGYQQAQAEAQRAQSSDESDYASAWIPFFPRDNSHSHGHHHHPRQTMTARVPSAPDVMRTPRH